MQDLSQRLARLQEFLNVDSNNTALMIDIAQLQLQLGLNDEAGQTAQQALCLSANLSTAFVILGIVAAQRGNHMEALEQLSRALTLGESSPTTNFYFANTLAHLGRYEEALKPAHAAADHSDICPHAPALVLRTLHCLGEFEEALKYAKSLGPKIDTLPKAQGILASILLDANCADEAATAANAALLLDPSDTDAATTAAFISLMNTEPALATTQFNDVLNTHPQLGRAQLGLGLSFMLAGDLSSATSTLESAAKSLSSHLGTLQALAWCHILQKNIPAAEKTLHQALEIDRNFAETHGGLAIVALMKGNLTGAREHAKRATALDRAGFTGLFAQSLINKLQGNAEQAQKIVENLLTTAVLPDGRTIFNAITEMAAKNSMGGGTRAALH